MTLFNAYILLTLNRSLNIVNALRIMWKGQVAIVKTLSASKIWSLIELSHTPFLNSADYLFAQIIYVYMGFIHWTSATFSPFICMVRWLFACRLQYISAATPFELIHVNSLRMLSSYPTFIKPATLIVISVLKQCASGGNSNFWLCVWNKIKLKKLFISKNIIRYRMIPLI